jgi:arylsulfatase A
MESNRDQPFFLFFSSHDLHVPRVVHERFQGATELGPRGDAIVELDWCVGELTKTLDRLKISENTLVVFCSDNGPVMDDGYVDEALEKQGNHQPAGPYRGGKYNVYEGGTRTPFITRWTGKISPGVSDAIVCTIDLAASCAALAGTKVPDDACLDSFNVLDALLGAENAVGRDHLVQQDNGQGGNYGLRVGNWKLLRHDSKRTKNTELKLQNRQVGRYQLFDLETDPSERTNVIEKQHEIAERLKQQLEEIISTGRSRP